MTSHSVAAWMLRRYLPAEHAEAVLGDLLEMSGKESGAFQRMLAGTLWSLGRRRVLGYVLALVFGGVCLVGLQSEFFASLATHMWSPWQRGGEVRCRWWRLGWPW